MSNSALVLGIVGMLSLLIAFILSLLKKLSQESPAYLFMNIMGGILLGYYAIALKSVPFLILEVVWVGFACYRLIGIIYSRSQSR